MKCAQDHATRDCRGTQAVLYTNCLGNHTANDKRCPKFPKSTRANLTNKRETSGGPSGSTINTNNLEEFPRLPNRSWNAERTEESASMSSNISEILSIFKEFNLSRFITATKKMVTKIKSAPDTVTKIGIVIETLLNFFE